MTAEKCMALELYCSAVAKFGFVKQGQSRERNGMGSVLKCGVLQRQCSV